MVGSGVKSLSCSAFTLQYYRTRTLVRASFACNVPTCTPGLRFMTYRLIDLMMLLKPDVSNRTLLNLCIDSLQKTVACNLAPVCIQTDQKHADIGMYTCLYVAYTSNTHIRIAPTVPILR